VKGQTPTRKRWWPDFYDLDDKVEKQATATNSTNSNVSVCPDVSVEFCIAEWLSERDDTRSVARDLACIYVLFAKQEALSSMARDAPAPSIDFRSDL
jgi:hypothetical protein